MSQRNVITSSDHIKWIEILQVIRLKAETDIKSKVVPAVNTGRITIGALLVRLGQTIQGSDR